MRIAKRNNLDSFTEFSAVEVTEVLKEHGISAVARIISNDWHK